MAATGTTCPRDGHALTLVRAERRLTCGDRGCACDSCHRRVTEQEARDWRGEAGRDG
jgi:hypothetical protein